MVAQLPHVRWGVIGTGWIATQFVKDVTVPRDNAKAQHTIQAVGSSSLEKGQTFVKTNLPEELVSQTTVYDSYDQVYNDPSVDVVYVATPHAFHKRDCLNAIAAGKHVLCEKPFTINEKDAQEVILAAKEKGVYILEGFWTRFQPLVQDLQRLIHSEKIIGNVHRVFCDFSMAMNIRELPAKSRLRDRSLGAGALLDIGVYSLMWGTVILGSQPGEAVVNPTIFSSQTVENGIDVATSVIMSYPQTGSQGILTCSLECKGSKDFCRIEGSKGTITVSGLGASLPSSFRVQMVSEETASPAKIYSHPGFGLHYEADAVALDLAAGKRENSDVMPLSETLRTLRITDAIRKAGGVVYPQDE